MDIRALLSGLVVWLAITPAQGHDIYKCVVNGKVTYTEEKCDDQARPLTLKELAAPLGHVDAAKIEGQETRLKEDGIKHKIARHQKLINKYRKKMQFELGLLQKQAGMGMSSSKISRARESHWEKEVTTHMKNISDSVDRAGIAEQMNAVVNRYKALIQAEEFQIQLLRQELDLDRVIDASKQNKSKTP